VSKKLQEKQRRRLADQMRKERQRKAARRSNLVTITIAAVIVGAVTAMVFFTRSEDNSVPPAPEGVSVADANCEDAQEHKIEGSEHIDPSQTVDYETSPPTSGNHWPTELVADPAFYTDPVASESLVHNMEHGQIIIWYSPDASEETANRLEGLVENANDLDNPDIKGGAQPLIAVPYDDVPEGASFVMTAWGASEACDAYSLAAVNEFRTTYQGRGPEQVTATFDG
jgi:Protein of unknown function (DUF3105)